MKRPKNVGNFRKDMLGSVEMMGQRMCQKVQLAGLNLDRKKDQALLHSHIGYKLLSKL